ncbi:phosphatidylglycerophosphatase [Pseudovibrio exalbescens]|uniref:phosphatidylglycerophosphatase n=1 Tax=Pseudovibrio exalbescens TaxID=197461 RepID=UPI0023664829|nr:phosphatidylglycerophosphatase [Pseudovibrio exalbescens]MDD7910717.1 phosphatidylglycerophosphatase [Pseudovibrio exalbescens]
MTDSWTVLIGFAGLLNPLALVIGALMGRGCDQAGKYLIAGFAAAAVSLFLEALLRLVGMPFLPAHESGALALFPFRMIGGALAAFIVRTIYVRWARS